jgi:uncharacterized membrane protein YfcA
MTGHSVQAFVVLALIGFAAQLVDGSLGMAYGVTSTSLLLATGSTPAAASASVHLAEVGTTLLSGASHWRFDNIDWRTVRWISIPGAAGASHVPGVGRGRHACGPRAGSTDDEP